MTSTAARRALASVTIALGAFVAALALTTMSSRHDALYSSGAGLRVLFATAESASALGAVVAVILAATVAKSSHALIATGLGIVLLPLSMMVGTSAEMHLRGFAAGLILGSCAALTWTRDRHVRQCFLVVGVIAAFAAAGPLQSNQVRYSDYLAPAPQTYLLVPLVVFAVMFVLAGVLSTWGDPTWGDPTWGDPPPETVRVLLIGIAVPVVGLALYWLFVRSISDLGSGGAMQNRWLLGIVVVPLLVGAAFALPALSGGIVLGALAYVSTARGSFETSTAIAFVVLLVAGAAVGWRRPSPLAGMAMFVVVAAAAVFVDSPLDMVDTSARVVLLPFATGLVFSSVLPSTSTALTIAVTAPIAVTVPIVAEFGWTAYTPLTNVEPAFSPSAWQWTSTAVSVFSVLAAGSALVVLRRRRRSEPLVQTTVTEL